MKNHKNIIIGLIGIFLLNGCALKEDDSQAMRVAKHTFNSPFYLIYGTGKLIELSIIGTLAGAAKLTHDVKESINLNELEEKANLNDEASQRKLGSMYYYGKGVDKDYTKAFQWYEKSALQGNSDSQNMLGIMYRFGFGIEKDINKSIEYYTKAIEQENHFAMNNLGHLYLFGDEKVDKNYKKAFDLYIKAEQLGNTSAMHALGIIYENGYGVDKNSKIALNWYEKAYQKGHVTSKNKVDELKKSMLESS